MMHGIISLIIFVCLVVPIIAGFRDGLYMALYSAVRTLFGLFVAMTFYEPVRNLLVGSVERLQYHPMPQYLDALIFPTLFALTFGVMRTLKMRFTIPKMEGLKLVDKIGGPVVGLLHGILIAGVLTLIWSFMPFAKYMPGDSGRVDEKRLFFDAGATAIRFYGHMTGRLPGGKPFLLKDEEVVKDSNGNGIIDPGLDEQWDDGPIPNNKWDRSQITIYRNRDEFGPQDIQDIFEGGL